MLSTRRFLTLLVVGLFLVGACGGDDEPAATPSPQASDEVATATADPGATASTAADVDLDALLADVVTYPGLSRDHQRGPIAYDLMPPVGGVHSPEWQTCGRYDVPIAPERAVHALEHGAVWIAHRPDVDMSALAGLVDAETHLLMSPVDGLSAPVVLSAWGAQLAVSGPEDPALLVFVVEYVRNGPESAPCDLGGVGRPPNEPGPPIDS